MAEETITTQRKQRTPTIHKKEIILNKSKLKNILDERGMEYIEFHKKVKDNFGLDLEYKSFMSLLDNRSTWKLLYSHAIATTLNINYTDIFEVVDVDVEKAKMEKKRWKERYQKKGSTQK